MFGGKIKDAQKLNKPVSTKPNQGPPPGRGPDCGASPTNSNREQIKSPGHPAMSSYGPTTAAAAADALEVAAGGSYRVCDTVVLICLACASSLIVLMAAVCFRRAIANGYAAAAAGANGGAGAAAAASCGLAPSVLSAIPMLAYRRGAGWAQCAICLAVVRDGETVRRLPACGHLFHVECIDLWLRSNATCPLCRRDVGEAAVAAEKV